LLFLIFAHRKDAEGAERKFLCLVAETPRYQRDDRSDPMN
jgi:hypothetical protein